jgi:carbonic anhydrase
VLLMGCGADEIKQLRAKRGGPPVETVALERCTMPVASTDCKGSRRGVFENLPSAAQFIPRADAMTYRHTKKPPLSAKAGLRRLIEGNRRFMRGQAQFPTVCKETLADLARAQQPYATILGCSDSRVPPELIFDADFGELFIVRVAGNVISPEVMGSLQYAGRLLHTSLFVVLGHEGCGAVRAALDFKYHGVKQRSRIQILVKNIAPGLPDSDPRMPADKVLAAAVEANVRWSMRQLMDTPEARNAVKRGAKLVGATYEIRTGRVRFLP